MNATQLNTTPRRATKTTPVRLHTAERSVQELLLEIAHAMHATRAVKVKRVKRTPDANS